MSSDNPIFNIILGFLETFVSLLTTGQITDLFFNFLVLLGLIIWFYCGLKIFFDIKNRYSVKAIILLFFFILGILTGPIGLLIYILSRPKYSREDLELMKLEHKYYFQTGSKIIECVKCESYLQEKALFCRKCGTRNKQKCNACESIILINDNYCFNCGQEVVSQQILVKQKKKPKQQINVEVKQPVQIVSSEKEDKPVDIVKEKGSTVFMLGSNFHAVVRNSFLSIKSIIIGLDEKSSTMKTRYLETKSDLKELVKKIVNKLANKGR